MCRRLHIFFVDVGGPDPRYVFPERCCRHIMFDAPGRTAWLTPLDRGIQDAITFFPYDIMLEYSKDLASMAFVQECAVGSVASADVARGSAAKCLGRA